MTHFVLRAISSTRIKFSLGWKIKKTSNNEKNQQSILQIYEKNSPFWKIMHKQLFPVHKTPPILSAIFWNLLYKKAIETSIYLFKVKNGNTWTMCEIYPKLTVNNKDTRMTSINKKDSWCHSGVFIVNWRRSDVFIDTSNKFHKLLWCFH